MTIGQITEREKRQPSRIVSARFNDADTARVAYLVAAMKLQGARAPTVTDAIKLALESTCEVINALAQQQNGQKASAA